MINVPLVASTSESYQPSSDDRADPPSRVIELRQYTLRGGKRDEFTSLFEGRLMPGQRAAGVRVHGHFSDANNPNRFVWLRGFPDMASRARSLETFYSGSVWIGEREAANAMITEFDNVLLLRSLNVKGFTLPYPTSAVTVLTICLLRQPVVDEFLRYLSDHIKSALSEAGATAVQELQTEYSANNFPRLPVREGEHAFVWVSTFGSSDEYWHHVSRLGASAAWRKAQAGLQKYLRSPLQRLELRAPR